MTVSVSPTTRHPTHDVSLEDKDGVKIGLKITDRNGVHSQAIAISPVDRTAMKTTTNSSPTYSDFEPPYIPIVQANWSGGRGALDFETDASRYADGMNMWTWHDGKAFLAPRADYCDLSTDYNQETASTFTWTQLINGARYIKTPVEFLSNPRDVVLFLRKRGSPANISIKIYDGVTEKASATLTASQAELYGQWHRFTMATGASGTFDLWIDGGNLNDADNCWEILCMTGSADRSPDNSDWVNVSFQPQWRVCSPNSHRGYFFEYRRALYYLLQRIDNNDVILFVNGDRGACDSNAGQLTKVIDATKSWATDEWVGCTVFLLEDGGERVPYRTITANDATSLTVDTAWETEQTTSHSYVILGSKKWTIISTTGITKFGRVFVSSRNVAYFCQGKGTSVRRMREYNNAGTWTRDFADDGFEADGLAEAAAKVWRSVSTAAQVSNADLQDWGSNLTFGTAITCGDSNYRINSIYDFVAGSEETIYVFKEEGFGFIDTTDSVYVPIVLREMEAVASPANGTAVTAAGVYLIFNMGAGVEQYYNMNLDDVGPNVGEGLPADRKGNVSALASYPGRIYAGVDAGSAGYSSVLTRSNGGWHEVFRASKGQNVRAIHIQPVPGGKPDLLWISCGSDVAVIPHPSDTTNPLQDSEMTYAVDGYIHLARMSGGMKDIIKFVKAFKVVADGLGVYADIEIDYRLDGDTGWTTIDYTFDASPMDEADLSATFGLAAKTYEIRLRVRNYDATSTPVLYAVLIEAVARVSDKYIYSFSTVLQDKDVDLQGHPYERAGADAIIAQLSTWSTSTMLLMRSTNPALDNRLVFLLPIPRQALKNDSDPLRRGYFCSITLQDA